jgi:hypothetical protein
MRLRSLCEGILLTRIRDGPIALVNSFTALDEENVPKNSAPDDSVLRNIIEAREDGRRFVVSRSENCLTNWFSIVTPPHRIRYYHLNGALAQVEGWLDACRIPLFRSIGLSALSLTQHFSRLLALSRSPRARCTIYHFLILFPAETRAH